jgi:hypothetical protein
VAKKSEAAHLTIVPTDVEGGKRIARIRPPPAMAPNVRAHWISIVNSLSADHFRPSDSPLLSRYVECCAMAEAEDITIADHLRICKTMALLATRLRLAPSTRGHARTTARQKMSGRSWELEIDG